MRRHSFALLAVFTPFVLAAACSRQPETPAATEAPAPEGVALTAGWSTTDGIDTPESVYVDRASGFIYVSQVAGAPDARDGNGRIVQMRGDGTVVNANFTTGLNAPKGVRGCDGSLWTADLGEVVEINATSGEIVNRVAIPDAAFLNDVECAPGGGVFVSDMMGNRIYRVTQAGAEVWAEGEQLEFPNGLLVDGNRLIVGGWGRPGPDFTTEVPGRLFALDLNTREKTLITPEPFANIDGVESDGRGGYIITDYIAGKLLRVSADGQVTELQTFMPGSADHAFVAEGNIAVIPHMNENRVASYALTLD